MCVHACVFICVFVFKMLTCKDPLTVNHYTDVFFSAMHMNEYKQFLIMTNVIMISSAIRISKRR